MRPYDPSQMQDMTGTARFDEPLMVLITNIRERYNELDEVNRGESASLIQTLWPLSAPSTRAKASHILANWPKCPPALLNLIEWAMLAQQQVLQPASPSAAAPKLRSALDIARNGSLEDLRLLAAHSSIAEEVIDSIVLRSDQKAFRFLAANKDVQLTRSAWRVLAMLSQNDGAIRQSLMQRRDLSNAATEQFWPALNIASQASLIAAGWTLSLKQVEEIRTELTASQPVYAAIGADGRALYHDVPLLVRKAGRALMEGQAAEAAILMGRAAGIEEGLALNLALGRLDRGALILARLADLKSDALLALLARRLPPEAERLPYAASLRLFEAMTLLEATQVLEVLEGIWRKTAFMSFTALAKAA